MPDQDVRSASVATLAWILQQTNNESTFRRTSIVLTIYFDTLLC